jgi:flagellar protein FliO/FliZ
MQARLGYRATMRALSCAFAVLGANAAAAPAEQADQSLLMSFLLMVGVVTLLLLLGYLALRWLRRSQGRAGKSNPFRFHASFPLGARERIVLIEVAGRFLVLGVTPQHVDLLLELPEFLSRQADGNARRSTEGG